MLLGQVYEKTSDFGFTWDTNPAFLDKKKSNSYVQECAYIGGTLKFAASHLDANHPFCIWMKYEGV